MYGFYIPNEYLTKSKDVAPKTDCLLSNCQWKNTLMCPCVFIREEMEMMRNGLIGKA